MYYDNVEVDKKILFDYVKNSEVEVTDLVGLTNLYKNYIYVNSLLNKDDSENKSLVDYENQIYTVRGSRLTEIQRVELEFNRIDKKLESFKNHLSSVEFESIKEEILVLKKIFLEYCNENDNEMLIYIKKGISILQAKLGLKIYFLSASYDAFIEKYLDISANKKHILEKNKQ